MYRGRRNRLRGEQGFTLVESIVVLFILGLLVALALLTYNRVRHTASRVEARAVGREWRTLDWASYLTKTATRTCSGDSQIGYSEHGANWNFATSTNAFSFATGSVTRCNS
jgi:prepilin-type N-terminal cleavage/methylation domain-containing protein